MKRKIIGLCICMMLMLPVSRTVFAISSLHTPKNQIIPTTDGTEYWALLVGVNEFKNHPYMTSRSVGNDIPPTDLCNLLLASDHWKSDHIRLITGKNASIFNVCKGFRWMHRMADADDICLFYIASHGGPIYDMPPRDENGGYDTAALDVGHL